MCITITECVFIFFRKGVKMTDDKERAGNQENASNVQPCCDGGSCCSSGSDGGGKSWKIVVFVLIVVAAGVVLARSLIGRSNPATDQTQQLFATVQPGDKPDTPEAVNATTETQVSNQPASSLWGQPLDSLASLNEVAADTDAVFVLLAADDPKGSQAATEQIEAAAKTIRNGGTRVSAFRLKQGAPNYASLTQQLSSPCVLAMVRGGGVSGVPADQITETKLVQAFVAASRPASGCCPAGSGASCP
ncbi:MAG: hypothetical protein A2Z25_06650 [Planctomycetes bacterium RBG_16_55_9]|nr:MAG: hypothetical protein A2Z25_06650 [Planctomycetes bacterium RBG_16_55_9]